MSYFVENLYNIKKMSGKIAYLLSKAEAILYLSILMNLMYHWEFGSKAGLNIRYNEVFV